VTSRLLLGDCLIRLRELPDNSVDSVVCDPPYNLRHRCVSLLHLAGMPWARIGELVGHKDITTTSHVYTHVVADERKLDYSSLLGDVSSRWS
jgi:DNA modification methylase